MGQMTTKEYLENVQVGIENELARNVQALPEGFNKQRFTLNCITVMKDNLKDFSGIDTVSVAVAFAKELTLDWISLTKNVMQFLIVERLTFKRIIREKSSLRKDIQRIRSKISTQRM